MRLKPWMMAGMVLLLIVAGLALLPWAELSIWVSSQQRAFQNLMAQSLQSIKAGDLAAMAPLCLATASYGFVHALGPGHGKVLLGGVAVASGATLKRMVVLSVIASLAQSLSAILIVMILLQGFRLASSDAVEMTEMWLAPISHIAIAGIGAVLVIRGVRVIARSLRRTDISDHAHEHDHSCGCGHKHGVSVEEANSLNSRRDALALIASIAVRPCTGALFLLVIAARFDIFMIGVIATLAMGLGTALFNILAASSGVAAHRLAHAGDYLSGHGAQQLSGSLHVAGGLLIVGLSILLFMP